MWMYANILQKKNQDKLEEPFKDSDIDNFDSMEQLKRSDQTQLVTKLATEMEEKTGECRQKYNIILAIIILNFTS